MGAAEAWVWSCAYRVVRERKVCPGSFAHKAAQSPRMETAFPAHVSELNGHCPKTNPEDPPRSSVRPPA